MRTTHFSPLLLPLLCLRCIHTSRWWSSCLVGEVVRVGAWEALLSPFVQLACNLPRTRLYMHRSAALSIPGVSVAKVFGKLRDLPFSPLPTALHLQQFMIQSSRSLNQTRFPL